MRFRLAPPYACTQRWGVLAVCGSAVKVIFIFDHLLEAQNRDWGRTDVHICRESLWLGAVRFQLQSGWPGACLMKSALLSQSRWRLVEPSPVDVWTPLSSLQMLFGRHANMPAGKAQRVISMIHFVPVFLLPFRVILLRWRQQQNTEYFIEGHIISVCPNVMVCQT